MDTLRKVVASINAQIRARGKYIAFMMNLIHFVGVIRGLLNQIMYLKNIKSSVFFLQANSRFEIFNKNSKVHIGKFVFIRKNASFRIDFNGFLDIGEKVFINDNCNINCVNKVTIGRHTKIAPNVCINDHDHNYKDLSSQHLSVGEVIIGENVWIGSNVVILKDTIIGNNAVIAAGSVVKGYIPENTLFVNKRNNQLIPYSKKELKEERIELPS